MVINDIINSILNVYKLFMFKIKPYYYHLNFTISHAKANY